MIGGTHSMRKGLASSALDPITAKTTQLGKSLDNFTKGGLTGRTEIKANIIKVLGQIPKPLDPALVTKLSDSKNKSGFTLLQTLCRYTIVDPSDLEALLESGVNPNITDTRGKTALHHFTDAHASAPTSATEAIRVLIKYDADPTLKDASGSTPFHTAALKRDRAAIKAFLDAGVDPATCVNKRGTTVLAILEKRGLLDT